MRNSGLEEAQAGIKIARRNISNLIYGDDTTLPSDRALTAEALGSVQPTTPEALPNDAWPYGS